MSGERARGLLRLVRAGAKRGHSRLEGLGVLDKESAIIRYPFHLDVDTIGHARRESLASNKVVKRVWVELVISFIAIGCPSALRPGS